MKTCRRCNIEQPVDSFQKYRRNADGLHSYCNACNRARLYDWRERNREKVNAYSLHLYQTDDRYKNIAKASRINRTARKRSNDPAYVSAKELSKLRSMPCAYCGSTDSIHVDHIVPLARGGRHSIGNLQPLCSRHNRAKGTMFWFEFKNKQISIGL